MKLKILILLIFQIFKCIGLSLIRFISLMNDFLFMMKKLNYLEIKIYDFQFIKRSFENQFKNILLRGAKCTVLKVKSFGSTCFYNFERRSNQIRDLQSKSKKPSNKQYKQYVKKLIENNPNHIDSQRRLKIDNSSSIRCELREKIERKMGDDEKQMWRSGVVRFIKPKISQRDYKRFKKLFDIFTKSNLCSKSVQKTKHQILSLTFSSSKYIKESNSLFQNEKIKQLKQSLLKLQLEQEKILLETQNDGKENKSQAFSLQKIVNHYKKSEAIEKKLSDHEAYDFTRNPSKISDNQRSNNESKCTQSPDTHQRNHSELNRNSSSKEKQFSYLTELHDFIWSLDGKKRKNIENPRQRYVQSSQDAFEEIKNFIATKQKTIDQLFVSLTNVNNINHKEELQSNTSDQVPQSTLNQFNKFHQIEKKAKALQNNPQTQQNKRFTSFKSLFHQLQQDLTEFKQVKIVKERNNDLTKKLLATNKELQKCEEEKASFQRLLRAKMEEEDFYMIVKRQNQLLHKKNQKLEEEISITNQKMQKSYQEIQHLKQKLQESQSNTRQSSKFQKYYRQALTLEQQVKILSDQNQKLIQEIKKMKQEQEKQQDKKQNIHDLKESTIKQQKDKQKMAYEQKKNPKQKDPHEKSIKPCSSTSLIYKEFEKKNKKLNDQNSKLLEKIKHLNSQINDLKQTNQSQTDTNQESGQQISKLRGDNKFLQEENHVLLQENKKIEEEFEYIVKEKLEIESALHRKQNQLKKVSDCFRSMKDKFRSSLVETSEIICELKEDKEFLSREISRLNFGLKEVFEYLNQQISNALQVFVYNNIQVENIDNDCKDTQQGVVGDEIGNSQFQQEHEALLQQYQALTNELNHCLYELNSYKGMLNQVEIEKQLQKKYFSQDISQLQLQIIRLENQSNLLRIQLQNSSQRQIQKIKNESFMQTQITSERAIQSNVFSLYEHHPISKGDRLSIKSNEQNLSLNNLDVEVSHVQELKINCESISIKIQSSTHKSLHEKETQTQHNPATHLHLISNIISISQLCHIEVSDNGDEIQKMINFQDWIDEMKLESLEETQGFRNFCELNLRNQESNYNQTELDMLKKQNNRLNSEIQKLTKKLDTHNQKSNGIQSMKSPLRAFLSSDQKVYHRFQNMEDQHSEKKELFGSLYNKFKFPKLEPAETREQYHQYEEHKVDEGQHKGDEGQLNDLKKDQIYLPLQPRNNMKDLKKGFSKQQEQPNSIKQKEDHINSNQKDQIELIQKDQTNKVSFSYNEEEDQSFDLCII